jgi:hypothetical protein
MTLDDLCRVVPMELLQDKVEPAEPVVRDTREEVVGQVHVLAVDEDSPSRERVGKEHARVGQSAGVGICVLVDVA